MKKYLYGFLVLLFTQNVFAVQAFDMLISQRNSTNTGYNALNPVSPTTTDGIFYYDLSTHSFIWLVPGNFTRASGTLNATPSVNDLSDATTIGKGLVKATSQSSARSLIGAGDGDYNNLTNQPTPITDVNQLANGSGYQTAANVSATLSSYPTNSVMNGALSGKIDNLTGTTLQYMRGDGTLATSLSVFDAAGAAAAAQAYAIQRGNQTGTQLSTTISDFNTAADARVTAGITGKENTITAGTTSQYWRGDKSWQTLDKTSVGLGSVDNTSDTSKPVSTATQTALNLKANIASPTFSGTVSGITSSMVGLGNVDNTSDSTKNAATATLTNKTISGSSNAITNIAESSVTNLVTDLAGKFPNPTGTTSQVVLGNGTLGALPVPQVIQRVRVQTNSTGDYTWTYPVAYGSGVIPIISAMSETASSTIPQGVQIVGVPTNTSATFKVINLPSTSVLSIVVLGAPTAAQAYIHLTAVAP